MSYLLSFFWYMNLLSTYNIMYINGASRWTQNVALEPWVIYTPTHVLLHTSGICLVHSTNNQFEYVVEIDLPGENNHLHIRLLDVLLDSQLVILQLNNVYHVHDPCRFHKYLQVRLLSQNFESITFTHILRHLNQVANYMTNEVLDWHLSHWIHHLS